MYKLEEIKELINLLDQTTVQELEIENEGFRLAIRKAKPAEAAAVAYVAPATNAPVVNVREGTAASVQPVPSDPSSAVPQTAEEDRNLHRIVSPMVGTFYRAPAPDAPPYVNVGDRVNEKTIVCIIEAMKLMNEIEAEVEGEIVEILVENGQLVEYGQPLFLVKKQS